ncbi:MULTISPECIES: hypothetical protein [Streptomyces]|uniref:Uncharacterized protein n=1 Tax=Streptomyces apricus TaxID=1828112 RepID=A0A5B0BH47_9ACTN|nr:hypothetical protein [Streptomyces apricus]KAA0941350.1 hypothetical protein FGF04_05095 [Streptomyces apricus]
MGLEQDRVSGLVDDVTDQAAEPSEDEREAWARVRRTATGMHHHQAKEALEDARRTARDGTLTGRDARVARAEAEEWERITETLSVHAGAYDSADDPFVQGELEGRAHHGPALPDPR